MRRVHSASAGHSPTEPVGSLPFYLSNVGALLRTSYVPCLLLLTLGCAPDNPSPAETFRHIHAAARAQAKAFKTLPGQTGAPFEDLGCFRQYTSSTTIDFLRDQGIHNKTAIHRWLTFLLQRLCSGAAYEIVSIEQNDKVASLALSISKLSDDRNGLTKVTFVKEAGQWKIDLRDAIQSWLDLDELAHESMKNMDRTIPTFAGQPDLLLPHSITLKDLQNRPPRTPAP